MANVYQVNMEGTLTEATTIAELKSILGDTKITKKAIEAGEYPMITIIDADTEDLGSEPVSLQDIADNSDNVEVIMVGDAPKAPVVDEPTEEVDNTVVEEDTTEDTVELTNENKEDKDMDILEVLVKGGYVAGATAILSDESANEEFIEWLFEANLPNDQVVITTVDRVTGNVEVKGYEGVLHYTDLSIVEPPKASGKGKANNAVNPDVDGYPEVGYFADEPAIKKYIKKLSNEQLEEWCKLEGAEWNTHDNPSINRMRMAMAIKAKHFTHLSPGNGKAKGKSKSKYADYSNEKLAELCLEHDVDVRDAKGDTRIERMYMIMDLRKAGVLA